MLFRSVNETLDSLAYNFLSRLNVLDLGEFLPRGAFKVLVKNRDHRFTAYRTKNNFLKRKDKK